MFRGHQIPYYLRFDNLVLHCLYMSFMEVDTSGFHKDLVKKFKSNYLLLLHEVFGCCRNLVSNVLL